MIISAKFFFTSRMLPHLLLAAASLSSLSRIDSSHHCRQVIVDCRVLDDYRCVVNVKACICWLWVVLQRLVHRQCD
jgi:hypothetical protein